MADLSGADGAVSWLTGAQHMYLDFQLIILGATFLFLITALFVLNRAVDEIGRARNMREQAEVTFSRLNGLLSSMQNGETLLSDPNRAARRVSMSGPARKTQLAAKTSAAAPPAAVRAANNRSNLRG